MVSQFSTISTLSNKPLLRSAKVEVLRKPRGFWDTRKVVFQDRYDKNRKLSIKRRSLWNSVDKVRESLEKLGFDQSSLDQGKKSLDVEGVIYALVHLPSNLVYVGQTLDSSFERFKHYYWNAYGKDKSKASTPLHRKMGNQNWKDFLIFPLEKNIKRTLLFQDSQTKKTVLERSQQGESIG